MSRILGGQCGGWTSVLPVTGVTVRTAEDMSVFSPGSLEKTGVHQTFPREGLLADRAGSLFFRSRAVTVWAAVDFHHAVGFSRIEYGFDLLLFRE